MYVHVCMYIYRCFCGCFSLSFLLLSPGRLFDAPGGWEWARDALRGALSATSGCEYIYSKKPPYIYIFITGCVPSRFFGCLFCRLVCLLCCVCGCCLFVCLAVGVCCCFVCVMYMNMRMWLYEYECYGSYEYLYTKRPPPWVQTTPSRGGITAAYAPWIAWKKKRRAKRNKQKLMY
jgi:hypothetical protein